MSIWTGIKSFFSSPKAVDNVLDKNDGLMAQVGGWIGNMSYTDEDRAENTAKAVNAVIEYAKACLSENTERSKTRRELSIAIMKVELSLVLLSVAVWPFNEMYAKFIWEVASSTLMFGAFWAVVVFFFGAYGYGQHIRRKKE